MNTLSDLEHLAQSNGIEIKYPYERLKDNNDPRKSILVLDYNQIESKGSNPISNLCRGLLLDRVSLDVIARPFHRFSTTKNKILISYCWISYLAIHLILLPFVINWMAH